MSIIYYLIFLLFGIFSQCIIITYYIQLYTTLQLITGLSYDSSLCDQWLLCRYVFLLMTYDKTDRTAPYDTHDRSVCLFVLIELLCDTIAVWLLESSSVRKRTNDRSFVVRRLLLKTCRAGGSQPHRDFSRSTRGSESLAITLNTKRHKCCTYWLSVYPNTMLFID